MQIQVELLREIVESADLTAAMHRIIAFPHERLAFETLEAPTDRQLKWNASAIRQFVTRHPRRNVPDSHVLRAKYHLNTVAEHISYAQNKRDLDTAENRFVKFALQDFRAFASRSTEVFESESGWVAAAEYCRRISGILDEWLGQHSSIRLVIFISLAGEPCTSTQRREPRAFAVVAEIPHCC